MTAAIVLSALYFVAALAAGGFGVLLTSQGAPRDVLRFWFLLSLACGVAGGLLGWAATS